MQPLTIVIRLFLTWWRSVNAMQTDYPGTSFSRIANRHRETRRASGAAVLPAGTRTARGTLGRHVVDALSLGLRPPRDRRLHIGGKGARRGARGAGIFLAS